MSRPTETTYHEWQQAFDHFNQTLFANALRPCLITLQREKRSYGYFCRERFEASRTEETTDEIAMNPRWFRHRPVRETLSTLVHEMVHQWQFQFGTVGRGRYHNKEWGDKMESIGLMPSNTGQPGGKRTGDQMTHYIIEGGDFERACETLLTQEFELTWRDQIGYDVLPPGGGAGGEGTEAKTNRSNRVRYSCPSCGHKAWAKPNSRLLCGEETCEKNELVPL